MVAPTNLVKTVTERVEDRLIEVVIPVFNEQRVLAASIDQLCGYLGRELPFRWRVTIADNASTDTTWRVAGELAGERPEVHAMHLDRKGRGLALREAWLASDADVVAYMDVDLSTNLTSFLPLVSPLLSGQSDLAIGSRLVRDARVTRQVRREVLSRGYNRLIRVLFGPGPSDAQCGFKAITAPVARQLVPLVQDEGWFFDTELLLLAVRAGLRIHEVPADWIEDLDSRVDLASTVLDDLRGLLRVRRRFWAEPPPVVTR